MHRPVCYWRDSIPVKWNGSLFTVTPTRSSVGQQMSLRRTAVDLGSDSRLLRVGQRMSLSGTAVDLGRTADVDESDSSGFWVG